MKFSGKILIALLACTLVTSAVLAQTTRGDIQGVVRDETGEPLPGVTVSISSEALQGTQNTVTDATGTYKFLVLPPGSYTATYSLSGYQTRTQENIDIRINSTTKVDVIMTSAFTEEVVVTSESPLVDTTSTTLGVDLGSEFYKDLPVGRDYTSLVMVTPGAQNDDSGTAVYGSTGLENSYYIDGANTTGIELGNEGTQLNFEFIDEVQVKSGSYSAEYGRATGSMINVITKSGGNEFHGDVFGYYTGDSMQSDKKGAAASGAVSGTAVRQGFVRSDYGADLGGYIVKDRLWFFAAYDRVDNTDDWEVTQDFTSVGGPPEGDVLPEDITSDLWSAKLTWRITANQSLSAGAFADPTDDSGALYALSGPPTHYLATITTGGNNYSINYDGIFGQNLVVSARLAQHNEENTTDGPGIAMTAYYDQSNPLGNGTRTYGWDDTGSGIGYVENQDFSRDQYNVDVSYFVGNFAGSHEFKVGYEYEDLGVTNTSLYTGPEGSNNVGNQLVWRFYSSSRGYYYAHEFFMNERVPVDEITASDIAASRAIDTPSKNYAWYVQDTWQVLNNLSLNLGIRNDRQKLYNMFGEVSADIKDEWAPRLGFVWDALGNGKSKVFGHWGYFYESIPMDIVIRSFGGEIDAFIYNYSDDPNDFLPAPDLLGSARIRGGGVSRVDPGTQGQYIEEWVIGGEYEFAPNWAAGIKYINRSLPRVIEDALAIDGDYYIGNPSEGEMVQTYDAAYWYSYPGGPGECLNGDPNCHLHDIPAPVRDFTGVELTLQKRFSNNFQFLTSFLWSKLEGNYDGNFQASTGQQDPNLNSAYDYYDFSVNNNGRLSNDRPFQFKFDGSYRFDFGLNIGMSAYYRDGTPITAMGYHNWYRNWELYLSERGAFGRVDSQWEADLHFGYPLKLGSNLELNILLDVFQVFNNQDTTLNSLRYTVSQDYDVIDPHTGQNYPALTPENMDARPPTNASFNTPSRWQNPRSYRLGLRFSF